MEFVINNEGICSEVSDKNLILMIVSTARYNFELRQVIRETWGSVLQHDVIDENGTITTWNFRLIFIVGLPIVTEGPFHNRQLAEESEIFSDIIMGNFTDTYRHLSYKHLLSYKWVLNYCPTARFILKADDDAFVNIYHVVNMLHKVQQECMFICAKNVGQPAMRDKDFKTRVTVEEWPEVEFPPYCTGYGYLATTAVIPKLYSLRHRVPFLYIEDVFVTGILRTVHNRNFTRDDPNYIHIGNIAKQMKIYDEPEIIMDMNWTSPVITGILSKEISTDLMCMIWKLSYAEYYTSPESPTIIVAENRTNLCSTNSNE